MGAQKTRLWWALAAAITLQSFILYYELNYGNLVGLIPWHDCAIVPNGAPKLTAEVCARTRGAIDDLTDDDAASLLADADFMVTITPHWRTTYRAKLSG